MLMGTEFLFWGGENILKSDDGDSYTTLHIY